MALVDNFLIYLISMAKEKLQSAEQFAKDHWKEIFTGSFVGGAILLLVSYHRHKRAHKGHEDESPELCVIEAEVMPQIDESAMLLETGSYAVDTIPDVEILAEELAEGLIGRAKETMEALKTMAVFRKNRSKKE